MTETVTPGDRLGGRYRLERPLGAGGMATVWRAVDLVLDRAVAVKVPEEGWPGEFTRRLHQEAKAAAALTHPGITGVYDYGEHERLPYVVMELLEGETLSARLSRGPLSWQEAAGICAHVADALAAAHAAGVVHRDIKPANVFLTRVGVKVLDFGIAFTGPSASGGPLLGTPAYVAPELLSGTPPAPAVDLYSLGVVLQECLAAPPSEDMPSLAPDVPHEVAALFRRCLDEDPVARPTASEAARVLADATGVQLATLPSPQPAGSAGGRTDDPPDGPPRDRTRVLDDPAPPGPAPLSGRRPPVIAGAAAAVIAFVAVLVAALSPESESSPPATAPPAASPPATETAVACSVSYRVDGTWPDGFQATVRITNLGDGAIDGWRLGFEFPGGQAITQLWNGSRVQDGPSVTVTAAGWNRSIPPRGTAEFGFLGSGEGGNAGPARFTLNGGECRS